MKLVAFAVEGYRRFAAKTSVKLHGDLVAFVGPNEAGKSSLLRAIAHLHRDGGFEPNERPRRTNLATSLSWHFQLDDADKAALEGVPDSEHIERAVVTKKNDGSRSWSFEPRNPVRDRSGRGEVASRLTEHRDLEPLRVADVDEEIEFDLGSLDRVCELLVADRPNYNSDEIAIFRDLARRLRGVQDLTADEADEDEPQEDRTPVFADIRDEIASALEGLAEHESVASPFRQAVDRLTPRLPTIELFDDPDRDLASEYELTEVADSPPAALGHLASLADLDLKALRDEAASRAIADVATRRNAANSVLLAAFDQSWNQQGIAVQIDVQGTILHIQATTPEDSGLSDIGERSDGMRWFAALLAFTHGWTEGPILLVDEIEKHLHYDAQADLIAVLAKQQFTSKVIYTTHSFGCLPFDLGTGVRVVQPIDSATSRLENGFWKRGAGFSPLLASMGAAAMSFTPTRHALIGEGAADAILLPTLLRQASGEDRLGFQIAPGLSSVAAIAVADLDAEAGRVGFVVDGDEGGRAIVEKLTNAGVSNDRIIVLTDPKTGEELEIEDFVDFDVYVKAANDELRCWNDLSVECKVADLAGPLCTKSLARWCESQGIAAPDKTAVAQRVVDAAAESSVYARGREKLLKSVLVQARRILDIA